MKRLLDDWQPCWFEMYARWQGWKLYKVLPRAGGLEDQDPMTMILFAIFSDEEYRWRNAK